MTLRCQTCGVKERITTQPKKLAAPNNNKNDPNGRLGGEERG